MGAESVTGGVRDTLAAALYDEFCDPHRRSGWEQQGEVSRRVWTERADRVVLAALSSPEVVRVATEALTEHRGIYSDQNNQWFCCFDWRDAHAHAAHQWSVLVAALRGER